VPDLNLRIAAVKAIANGQASGPGDRTGRSDEVRERNDMIKRWMVQLFSLAALHSSWGPEVKWLCNPVLSCHSCALAWFACPIGIFVHYSGFHLFPLLAAGAVVLVGVLVGRLLCGWVCPFGFLLDLLYKIPSPKFTLPSWTGWIKYFVLGGTVFLLPFLFGETTAYSFCRFCPASALQVTIPLAAFGGPVTISGATLLKIGILAAVLVLGVLSLRSFCKVLCPIGALLGPLNFVSLWVIKTPTDACVRCSRCDRLCPSGGDPSTRIAEGIPANRALDCIVCHDCQNACPVRDREPSPPPAGPPPMEV
jgi:polyferredoxin